MRILQDNCQTCHRTGGIAPFSLAVPTVESGVPRESFCWRATVGGTPGNAMPYFSTAIAANAFYVKSPTVNANDIYNWMAS